MTSRKCRAQGGPSECTNPKCPERQEFMSMMIPSSFQTLSSLPQQKPLMTWTEKDTVLFKTIHGSRLYGLNNENSDEDYYVVTPTVNTKKLLTAKQRIDGDLDTVTVDFSSFVKMAQSGVPQALETMFSRKSTSPFFEDFRTKWFASDPEVVNRYLRTIHRFSLEDGPKKLKYKRHAIRLSLNLEELVYTGRFNPTLTKQQVRVTKRLADKEGSDYLNELNAVNPFDLDWTHD